MEVGTMMNHYYTTAIGKKKTNGEAGFQIKEAAETKEQTEAEKMEQFKKEFYEELSKITTHGTVPNAAVNISEEAFQNMQADPEYRDKVLSLIKRDWGDSYSPRSCSVLITVGATLDDYRGDSWPVGYDSGFQMRSINSFYKRTDERKEAHREQLEEYNEKRLQAKKLKEKLLKEQVARQELDKKRAEQSWKQERQLSQAAAAYEANVILETPTEGIWGAR